MIPVTVVSGLVHIYSITYLYGDPHISRYYSYLSLFTLFMNIQVQADSILVLLIGWEGVGQVSYLQINYWYTRLSAYSGAIKAQILNRLGDTYQLLGLLLTVTTLSTTYIPYLYLLNIIYPTINYCITLQLILGCVAKSGQVGQSVWQTSAMEGPTPVSALLHAATMVTAGVYLIITLSPILIHYILFILIIIGGISAVQGSSGALVDNDIKRVIAYSTTSQQGYMILTIGLGYTHISLYHLILHAYFKSLQFLGSGTIIGAILHNQDLRRMGGQIKQVPMNYIIITTATPHPDCTHHLYPNSIHTTRLILAQILRTFSSCFPFLFWVLF